MIKFGLMVTLVTIGMQIVRMLFKGQAPPATLRQLGPPAMLVLCSAALSAFVVALIFRVHGASAKPGRVLASGRHVAEDAVLRERGRYALAVIEFDEQGVPFDRAHVEALEGWLDRHRAAIVVTFNHGWQHNAAADDPNLRLFERTLERMADRRGGDARPILGVFIGWQGQRYGGWLALSSFWDRRRRAEIVAQGSVRELHARLSRYRTRELARAAAGASARPVLVHVGHSLGAYMLYLVQAQALMTAALEADAAAGRDFDLLIAINPAFSALAFQPLRDLAVPPGGAGTVKGRPLLIVLASEADGVTRFSYEYGMKVLAFDEGFSRTEQKERYYTALGNYLPFVTHELRPGRDGPVATPVVAGGPALTESLFGVVRVDRRLMSGHGDIFGEEFADYLEVLVSDAVRRAEH